MFYEIQVLSDRPQKPEKLSNWEEKGGEFQVVEGGKRIFSGRVGGSLNDSIYFSPLNCYFLLSSTNLYRKDIDGRPPYVFMRVVCLSPTGACLRYSKAKERLFIIEYFQNISVINPRTKRYGLRWMNLNMKHNTVVSFDEGERILDFKLFGEEENRIVSVSQSGTVSLYALDYGGKRGRVALHQIIEGNGDHFLSLGVCGENECALVTTSTGIDSSTASKTILLSFSEDVFTMKALIDHSNLNWGVVSGLQSIGCIDSHSVWVGLSFSQCGSVEVFDYDTQTEELTQLREKRADFGGQSLSHLHPFENEFYFLHTDRKLMCLGVSV